MNHSSSPCGAKLNEVELPVESTNQPIDVLEEQPPCDPLDQWSQTVMRHMQRMAVDEEYRKSIAQHLS